MSLVGSFRQFSSIPSHICRQCRRSYATTEKGRGRQSATGGLAADLLKSSLARTQARTAFMSDVAPSSPSTPRTSSISGSSSAPSSHDIASSTLMSIAESKARQRRAQSLAEMALPYTRVDLEKQMGRRWKVGEVYAPHDLSWVEQKKWKTVTKKKMMSRDVLDKLGIDPLKEYKNFSMMSEFVTETGRIKPRSETGLRPKNQRKMARAIRRAMGVGLIPTTYRHPELLKLDMEGRGGR